MGRKPIIGLETVFEWKAYSECRKADGASLWRIASELAQSSGHATVTIWGYLDDKAYERRRLCRRMSARRQAAKHFAYLHPEASARTKARREWLRNYLRNYFRVRRHPDRYLAQVFANTSEASLETIASRLAELCEGVKFRSQTVEHVFRQYQTAQREGRIRGPPLEELHSGYWYYGPPPSVERGRLIP